MITRLEAAKLGLKVYDYKPCPRCGHEERYVKNGNCPKCLAAGVKKQRQKYNQIAKESQKKNKQVTKMDNKTFALNLDDMKEALDRFSIDECGRLIKAIYQYAKNGTMPTKDYLKESYSFFIESVVPQLEEDALLSDEERFKKIAQQKTGDRDALV